MKKAKCITFDTELAKLVSERAKIESRNFSNMLEYMAKEYLLNNKK